MSDARATLQKTPQNKGESEGMRDARRAWGNRAVIASTVAIAVAAVVHVPSARAAYRQPFVAHRFAAASSPTV